MYRRYFRFERKQKEHFWNHDDAVSFRWWITCPVEEQNTHLWKTGTGKSKLAIEIGKRFGGKILSADSMHILANKTTAEEISEWMSTTNLDTDCLGHLASNGRSLQENNQSERACYCSHIIRRDNALNN